jgi:uncharacterized protein (UPF0332 family)
MWDHEPEYSRFCREACQWRENADYHFGVEITEEKTRKVLEQAERTVARLEQFLRERGLLTENGEG